MYELSPFSLRKPNTTLGPRVEVLSRKPLKRVSSHSLSTAKKQGALFSSCVLFTDCGFTVFVNLIADADTV